MLDENVKREFIVDQRDDKFQAGDWLELSDGDERESRDKYYAVITAIFVRDNFTKSILVKAQVIRYQEYLTTSIEERENLLGTEKFSSIRKMSALEVNVLKHAILKKLSKEEASLDNDISKVRENRLLLRNLFAPTGEFFQYCEATR